MAKKDSALSSISNINEYQQQIVEKDEQIRKLNTELDGKNEQIQQLIEQLNK